MRRDIRSVFCPTIAIIRISTTTSIGLTIAINAEGTQQNRVHIPFFLNQNSSQLKLIILYAAIHWFDHVMTLVAISVMQGG